jgi:hypothetical protein
MCQPQPSQVKEVTKEQMLQFRNQKFNTRQQIIGFNRALLTPSKAFKYEQAKQSNYSNKQKVDRFS